jgi:hypothetical protein
MEGGDSKVKRAPAHLFFGCFMYTHDQPLCLGLLLIVIDEINSTAVWQH